MGSYSIVIGSTIASRDHAPPPAPLPRPRCKEKQTNQQNKQNVDVVRRRISNLVTPDEPDDVGTGHHVAVKVDVGALADVVLVQTAAQLQPRRRHVCEKKELQQNNQSFAIVSQPETFFCSRPNSQENPVKLGKHQEPSRKDGKI